MSEIEQTPGATPEPYATDVRKQCHDDFAYSDDYARLKTPLHFDDKIETGNTLAKIYFSPLD